MRVAQEPWRVRVVARQGKSGARTRRRAAAGVGLPTRARAAGNPSQSAQSALRDRRHGPHRAPGHAAGRRAHGLPRRRPAQALRAALHLTGGEGPRRDRDRSVPRRRARRGPRLVLAEAPRILPVRLLPVLDRRAPPEAIGLRWGDVDLRQCRVKIRRSRVLGRDGDTKTRRSRRDVIIHDGLEAVPRAHMPLRPAPDDFVFTTRAGAPIDESNFYQRE
jgi:integrase